MNSLAREISLRTETGMESGMKSRRPFPARALAAVIVLFALDADRLDLVGGERNGDGRPGAE
jgi:hypothetical protein